MPQSGGPINRTLVRWLLHCWVEPSDEQGLSGAIVDKELFGARPPKGAVIVVEVADVSDTLERVRQYGGEVLGPLERLLLSGAGDADGAFDLAMFADPKENEIALIKG